MEIPTLEHHGATNQGEARANNEDSLLVGAGPDGRLFAVADGIGGHEAGEVASGIATAVFEDLSPVTPLESAASRADRLISACQDDREFAGMGTTVVALRFFETGETTLGAEIVHVGDSRAYLLRDGRLEKLTEDHTLAAQLARAGPGDPATAPGGAVVPAPPRPNILARALGSGDARADHRTLEVRPADRLLLCSDGLTDALDEPALLAILTRESEPERATRSLLAAASEAGALDDVTAVVVDVVDRQAQTRATPRLGLPGTSFRRFGLVPRFLLALRRGRLPGAGR